MDNYLKIVKDDRACGELDHPDDSVVNLKNVSHIVTDCWWEGKACCVEIIFCDGRS